jgi:hypothetical protein
MTRMSLVSCKQIANLFVRILGSEPVAIAGSPPFSIERQNSKRVFSQVRALISSLSQAYRTSRPGVLGLSAFG